MSLTSEERWMCMKLEEMILEWKENEARIADEVASEGSDEIVVSGKLKHGSPDREGMFCQSKLANT